MNKIAGFIIASMPNEVEICAEARRTADAIEWLRALLRAKNPPPWNFIDDADELPVS